MGADYMAFKKVRCVQDQEGSDEPEKLHLEDMMTTGMIVFWVVVGLLVFFACWLMIQAKHPIDALEENNEAPYKVERPFDHEINPAILASLEDAPLPSKPKRRYTKRSRYWKSNKLKAKLKKARAARKPRIKSK